MSKTTWSRMDLTEFHEAGLVWRVNESVLWPLGLALTVSKNEDGKVDEMFVQRVDPFDIISNGADVDEYHTYLDRFAKWVKARVR